MSPLSSSGVGGGGEFIAYLLNCSVCKGEFSSREKWMEHLTLEGHQNLAREDLQKDGDSLRECSLVIFTTYDLTGEGALKIIKYFGRDQTVWVTDFVWWEERPRFAVVQFESRKTVEHVLRELESFTDDLIQIRNQRIQVKGAVDLLKLEWKALLPGSNPTPLISPKSFQKLTKQSDPIVSPQNIEHDQLTNCTTEETIGEATELNSEDEDIKDDDSIKVLNQLIDFAKERQWEPPIFKLEKKRSSITCTILLNGLVYKPHRFKRRVTRSSQAKKLAAKFCLAVLKGTGQNIFETSDDHQEDETSPIAILKALSQKLHGKYPHFNVEKRKKTYIYRVVFNGISYKPSRLTGKAGTAEEAKLIAAQDCIKKIEKDYGLSSAQEYLSSPPSQLSDQLNLISSFVQIPDEKYNEIVNIVCSFREVLRQQIPSTQVIIFRNWFLKLRNSAPEENNEQLFIYIYADDGLPGSDGPPSEDNFTWIPGRLVQNAISQFSELTVCSEDKFPHPDDPQETRLGCKFLHKPSGIPFTVVNFRRTMVEVQCCRLVRYYCQFDPRIRSLLILARYWQITNGIHWGEPERPSKTAHQCLPEPHPLDWMILTFLMGENYVPSVRTILERPHKVIFERATVTDVGFTVDIDFAREWKEEKGFKTRSPEHFTLSTLQLFQNFLEFCSTKIFDQGGVIINSKDGEVLEISKFLSGEFKSKLTSEEISVLKQFQENSDNESRGKYCVDFKRWNWYMINPLIISWRFSVPERKQELRTIESTRKTGERLKNFLKLVESEGVEKGFEICGASLSEILKVDKEIPVLDLVPSKPSRKRAVEVDTAVNAEEDEGPSTSKKAKFRKTVLPGPAVITFDLEISPVPSNEDKTSLSYQLYSLLEEFVVNSDDQFDKVLESVNFLQKVFFHSNDPTCKVSLFRNWNLKLRGIQKDFEDMPLVYVYNRKHCLETDSGFSLLPSGKIWSILKSGEVKKKINVLEGPTPKGQDPSTFKKGWTLECKGFGGDEEKFKLCLFSSHQFLFEVEVDGLLEYICKFDGRVYQMIKLAYLWMGLNELTLGDGEDGGLSSLQWLVIFWMCHRKMVPSPKEIQERGCHKVMRDGGTGVDLGWEEDKQFLEEWREETKGMVEFEWREDCVVGLLDGFKEFLEFCGWLGEGSGASWILNTRTGELIETKQFLKSQDILGNGDWCKNMNEEEIRMLRAQAVNFKDRIIYMTHPLNLQWRFGIRSDIRFVLKLMKAGGIRLKTYLNMRKSNGENATKKRFKSLRNVLNFK